MNNGNPKHEFPRVLVISHNPFSNMQNNGKTLEALLERVPRDNLAQIYLTRDDPDFDFCRRYYRIFDIEVLKNVLGAPAPGCEVKQEEYQPVGEALNAEQSNKLYNFVRNLFIKRVPAAICLRNLLWGLDRWKTDRLISWLDSFSPDIVFFQSSNCTFAFDLVEWVCERYKIPMIMETTDDYVTEKLTLDPFFWIDIKRMQGRYRRAANYARCVFAIGDKMAEEYSARFGGRYKVAMNSVPISGQMTQWNGLPDAPGRKRKILFAGNLGLNRWKVIEKIGQACELLARDPNPIDAGVEICSLVPPNKKILRRLTIPNRMKYIGALGGEQLAAARESSDLLLHVESFDRQNKFITRLSVSTKIPEYMASGRCILAVGPPDVASIEYVKKSGAGVVSSSLSAEDIANTLRSILSDGEARRRCVATAWKTAASRHNRDEISREVEKELTNRSN